MILVVASSHSKAPLKKRRFEEEEERPAGRLGAVTGLAQQGAEV